MSAPVRTPPSREAVAHHEAGHAVMAVAVGYRVASVTIEPVGDVLGRVRHRMLEVGDMEEHALDVESGDPVRRWRGRCALVRTARSSIAGPIAEGLYTRSPWWRPWSESIFPDGAAARPHPAQYDDDVTSVVRALEAAARGSSALLGYQNRLGREVRAYLTANWRAVEDVAALLLREGTVDGEAVEKVARESAGRHGLDLYPPSTYTPWWKPPRSVANPSRAAA